MTKLKALRPGVVIVNCVGGHGQSKTVQRTPRLGLFKAMVRWFLGRHFSTPVTAAQVVIFPLPSYKHAREANAAYDADLLKLVGEFGKNIVPPGFDSGFVKMPATWGTVVRGMRWIHYENVRAYYVCGLGASFLDWAFTFKPSLYPIIEKSKSELIVIILKHELI